MNPSGKRPQIKRASLKRYKRYVFFSTEERPQGIDTGLSWHGSKISNHHLYGNLFYNMCPLFP
jgi:hypothetical protein